MKRINKYKTADHFNLTGTRVEALLLVHKWSQDAGYHLVAVVPTEGGNELRDFTVRVVDAKKGIYDVAVQVRSNYSVEEVERVTILPPNE